MNVCFWTKIQYRFTERQKYKRQHLVKCLKKTLETQTAEMHEMQKVNKTQTQRTTAIGYNIFTIRSNRSQQHPKLKLRTFLVVSEFSGHSSCFCHLNSTLTRYTILFGKNYD